ncbi:hypothetical protein [Thauera linaloolentis]|uniref:Phosphoribosyltransferase n=1 Tax=Thauera linaloolentis (strain DSM 12138 / JCM 21573 / CCUG 41526 / CIP 105981 / IAM 15112 / NBRC 102519 / 47Lol) TaxID=1123367 RepID=N6Z6X4_THAL4|nr:hypothetical protein [Thauera linaloolentis]ENO87899.1 phosphoribosyltransferase [Thauera linaloolentis 47Lol = DSM 12138]MCM8567567.1 alpha/beta hydrolase [Thauera linaloolentis]
MKLRHTPLSIPAHGVWLDGMLAHSPEVRALALYVHSSGHPPLDQAPKPLELALQAAGFATMTVDLLTRHEAQHDADAPFNVPRLTERILDTLDWAAHQPSLVGLALGVVASGTGCAAAIRAAVRMPEAFTSIACLGGRPDLAGAEPLRAVRTPTRFVVAPDGPEAAILASAYPLLKGGHDWLKLPPARSEHDQEALAAQAACAWLGRHIPRTEEPDPPPPGQAPATPLRP